jgi:Tol biopolymer transport system component
MMVKKTISALMIFMFLLASCTGPKAAVQTNGPIIVLSAIQGGPNLLSLIFTKTVVYAVDTSGHEIAVPDEFKNWTPDMAWSPDGKWLAFTKVIQRAGNYLFDIYITSWPDQNKQIQVTAQPSSGDSYPSWSPDGNMITYAKNKKIYALDVSCLLLGQACDPKPSFIADGENPVWSPAGNQIVYQYSTNSDFKSIILIINLDEDKKTFQISPEGETCYRPQWAPDGTRVTFDCPDKGIYVVNSNGAGLKLLANGDYAKWSPDGKLIAFRGWEALDPMLGHAVGIGGMDSTSMTSMALFTINPAGTSLKRITSNNYQGDIDFVWVTQAMVSKH